jgi:hypothetical protein
MLRAAGVSAAPRATRRRGWQRALFPQAHAFGVEAEESVAWPVLVKHLPHVHGGGDDGGLRREAVQRHRALKGHAQQRREDAVARHGQ